MALPITLLSSLASSCAEQPPDGGCLYAFPPPRATNDCGCKPNPNVARFAGCNSVGQPTYFNSSEDVRNGVCLRYFEGRHSGISLDTCTVHADCIEGTECQSGHCTDPRTGVLERDRIVQTCVSPKRVAHGTPDWRAGCGTSDGAKILQCHRWWIGEEGMEWKRYLQFNPLGQGDSYAWAYDEAVCAKSGNTRRWGGGYPWCRPQDASEGAVDESGTVTDDACPW